jgi:hypothetical protein
VSAKQRLPAFPDLPSFAEASGVSDFDVVAWHMLVANAETARAIVDRLNSKMKEIMSNPDIQKRISNMGLIPVDPRRLPIPNNFLKVKRSSGSTSSPRSVWRVRCEEMG